MSTNSAMHLYFLLSKFVLVHSQWFLGEEKQQTTTNSDTMDASKLISATSPTQCVLKCQRKLKKGFFVEEKKQCFCLNSENEMIFSHHQTTVDGMLYEKHEVNLFDVGDFRSPTFSSPTTELILI